MRLERMLFISGGYRLLNYKILEIQVGRLFTLECLAYFVYLVPFVSFACESLDDNENNAAYCVEHFEILSLP